MKPYDIINVFFLLIWICMYINLAYRISLINIGTSFKIDCNLKLLYHIYRITFCQPIIRVGKNHCSADTALVTARPKDTMKNIYILILLPVLTSLISFNGKNIHLTCNMMIFIKVVLRLLFDEKEWTICSVTEKSLLRNSWRVFVKLR